ncbi:MAG: hypothetical protein AAF763_06810 [Pseudomonadota bacterium]
MSRIAYVLVAGLSPAAALAHPGHAGQEPPGVLDYVVVGGGLLALAWLGRGWLRGSE